MFQYYKKVSGYLIYIILIIFKIYCAGGQFEIIIGMMMCYTIINLFLYYSTGQLKQMSVTLAQNLVWR